MRPKLVVGNWKMHGSRAMTRELLGALRASSGTMDGLEVAVCPPFVYLEEARRALAGSGFAVGAQNVAEQAEGAHTGEVAAAMLADLECRYAIVGHSERRSLYGESDAVVATKVRRTQEAGLVPIACVGEMLAEREAGAALVVVDRQIEAILGACRESAPLVVAYEPVWAIGTGLTAEPDQAQEVHAHLRARLSLVGRGSTRLLYGGSVKPDNAAALFACEDIDGGLIGGAALDAEAFTAICAAARAAST